MFSSPTAPLLHTLYSLHWSINEPPLPPYSLDPSLPPSLHPLPLFFFFFCFVHSYNSWAVLSHTRLLRISEDADSDDDDGEYVDDYDDSSNHVF